QALTTGNSRPAARHVVEPRAARRECFTPRSPGRLRVVHAGPNFGDRASPDCGGHRALHCGDRGRVVGRSGRRGLQPPRAGCKTDGRRCRTGTRPPSRPRIGASGSRGTGTWNTAVSSSRSKSSAGCPKLGRLSRSPHVGRLYPGRRCALRSHVNRSSFGNVTQLNRTPPDACCKILRSFRDRRFGTGAATQLCMRLRALVVEDCETTRDGLVRLLENAGIEAVPAANGAEALAYLQEGNLAHVILLDAVMPVMDGWTFRRAQIDDPWIAD